MVLELKKTFEKEDLEQGWMQLKQEVWTMMLRRELKFPIVQNSVTKTHI